MIGALASLLIAAAQPVARVPDPALCLRVEAEELARTPDTFINRCVVVEGMGVRSRLYTDREGIYSDDRVPGPVPYVGLVDPARGELEDPAFVRVVGRATTCREVRWAQYERPDSGTVPPMCSDFSGTNAIIMVSERRVDRRRRYERLVGEEHRARHGSLIFPPADWDSLAHVLRMAEAFRRAIANRDAAGLARLHPLDPAITQHLLDDPASPFADLRDGRPRQTAVLLHSYWRRTEQAQGRRAFVCFCRTADCTGIWPIAFNDAVNRADRPFACTYWSSRGDSLWTPVNQSLLPEPARTAIRRRPPRR